MVLQLITSGGNRLDKGELTPQKARTILHDKEVRGHPLTDQQRKFMGAVAGGSSRKSEDNEELDEEGVKINKAKDPPEETPESELKRERQHDRVMVPKIPSIPGGAPNPGKSMPGVRVGEKSMSTMGVGKSLACTTEKSMCGVGNPLDWAARFSGTPMHEEALQCTRDRLLLNQEEEKWENGRIGFEELDKLSKPERDKVQDRDIKQRKAFQKEGLSLDDRASNLEVKLVDYRIETAKNMSKGQSGLDALGDFAKSKPFFVGPRGGKWEDPQFTISWKEDEIKPVATVEKPGLPKLTGSEKQITWATEIRSKAMPQIEKEMNEFKDHWEKATDAQRAEPIAVAAYEAVVQAYKEATTAGASHWWIENRDTVGGGHALGTAGRAAAIKVKKELESQKAKAAMEGDKGWKTATEEQMTSVLGEYSKDTSLTLTHKDGTKETYIKNYFDTESDSMTTWVTPQYDNMRSDSLGDVIKEGLASGEIIAVLSEKPPEHYPKVEIPTALPELQGSEKQIKWAKSIREDALPVLKEEMQKILRVWEKGTEEQRSQPHVVAVLAAVAKEFQKILSEKSSKWWIDHRVGGGTTASESIDGLIGARARNVSAGTTKRALEQKTSEAGPTPLLDKLVNKSISGMEVIMSGLDALGEFAKGGGPFIGPQGGKWADAQHTISWKEETKPVNEGGEKKEISGKQVTTEVKPQESIGKTPRGIVVPESKEAKLFHQSGIHRPSSSVTSPLEREARGKLQKELMRNIADLQDRYNMSSEDHADVAKIYETHAQTILTAEKNMPIGQGIQRKADLAELGKLYKVYAYLHQQIAKNPSKLAEDRKALGIKKLRPSSPEEHKTKIAKDTLKMNPAMTGVMGGPSQAEAKKYLEGKEGKKSMSGVGVGKSLAEVISLEDCMEKALSKEGVEGGAIPGIERLGEFAREIPELALFKGLLPTGEPSLGGSGEEQGGELEEVGKEGGKSDSDAGPPIKAPIPEKEKLSEDDSDEETLSTKTKPIERIGKSMGIPSNQADLVAQENAQLASRLRKGKEDVVVGIGVADDEAPEVLQREQAKAWNQGGDSLVRYNDQSDIEASELLKSENFYANGSPTVTTQSLIINQQVQCKVCNKLMAKSLSVCPHCGSGTLSHRILPGVSLEKSLDGTEVTLERSYPSILQPAKEAPDLVLPNGAPVEEE